MKDKIKKNGKFIIDCIAFKQNSMDKNWTALFIAQVFPNTGRAIQYFGIGKSKKESLKNLKEALINDIEDL